MINLLVLELAQNLYTINLDWDYTECKRETFLYQHCRFHSAMGSLASLFLTKKIIHQGKLHKALVALISPYSLCLFLAFARYKLSIPALQWKIKTLLSNLIGHHSFSFLSIAWRYFAKVCLPKFFFFYLLVSLGCLSNPTQVWPYLAL